MPPPAKPNDFLAELSWRGLLAQTSEGLEARLRLGPISAYNGIDPTAVSLHVGHLVPITVLAHLQRTGAGSPVALVGGGTGMIGDPSGKSAERNLLDEGTLDANRAAIRSQMERLLDFTGSFAARLLDNREWLARYGLLEFLRDIGKHFTLGYMLDKESVQTRMAAGISFTEFSYMTLQAADFLHLYRDYGVEMQLGGTEQWGNMTAGLELIRRVVGRGEQDAPLAFALAHPLLLNPSGTKFGKTEAGSVWLSPERTSPYAFYQYWIGQDDRDVGAMLRMLTLLPADEIVEVEEQQRARPEARPAQRRLAFEMTSRVHGRDEAERQVRVAEAVFSDQPLRDPALLDVLFRELPNWEFSDEDLRLDAAGVGVASGLYPSRSEANRQLAQGAFWINEQRMGDGVGVPKPIDGRYLVLRAGKKRRVIGRRREG